MAVTLTLAQFNRLLNRITVLEERYNLIAEALQNAMTPETFADLTTQLQITLGTVDVRLDEIDARVSQLEDVPITT